MMLRKPQQPRGRKHKSQKKYTICIIQTTKKYTNVKKIHKQQKKYTNDKKVQKQRKQIHKRQRQVHKKQRHSTELKN